MIQYNVLLINGNNIILHASMHESNYCTHNKWKYALKVCMKSWDSSYEDLLKMTSLPSMQCRRLQVSLCHLYKIIHGLTDFPDAPTTHQEFHYNSRSLTTGAIMVPPFRTSSHQHSFFPLTISEWNKLPKEITECRTLGSFKSSLLKYYNSV